MRIDPESEERVCPRLFLTDIFRWLNGKIVRVVCSRVKLIPDAFPWLFPGIISCVFRSYTISGPVGGLYPVAVLMGSE